MDTAGGGDAMSQPETFVEEILHHATPGTSAEPNTTQEPMLMRNAGNWLLMFHGTRISQR